MGEKSQINLKLENNQKERWVDHLEKSHEFSTISSLIRTSVEVMIEDSDEVDRGVPQELSADIDEMKEEIESIQRDVSTLLKHQRDEDDISEFALDVFDSLRYIPNQVDYSLGLPDTPEGVEREVFINQDAANILIDHIEAEGDGDGSQTAAAIAQRLDEDESLVKEAIEWLQKNHHPVVEVQLGGNTHYFKEE